MMTKEQVNIAVINGLKNKGIFIGNISLEVLEAFAGIMYEALTIHSVVSSNFICNSENRRKEKCKEQCAWCDGFN